MTLNELFTNIANAIRRKKGTTDKIIPTNFESEIESIESGTDTTDATATASDILLGKTAYVNGEKITGIIEKYNYSITGGEVSPKYKNMLDMNMLDFNNETGAFYSTQTIELKEGSTYTVVASKNFFGERIVDLNDLKHKFFTCKYKTYSSNNITLGFSFKIMDNGLHYTTCKVPVDCTMTIKNFLSKGYTLENFPRDEVAMYEGDISLFDGFFEHPTITITSKDGVTLHTANKYVNDDINVTFEGGSSGSSGIEEVTELPVASAENVGKIYRYEGQLYECKEVKGLYEIYSYGATPHLFKMAFYANANIHYVDSEPNVEDMLVSDIETMIFEMYVLNDGTNVLVALDLGEGVTKMPYAEVMEMQFRGLESKFPKVDETNEGLYLIHFYNFEQMNSDVTNMLLEGCSMDTQLIVRVPKKVTCLQNNAFNFCFIKEVIFEGNIYNMDVQNMVGPAIIDLSNVEFVPNLSKRDNVTIELGGIIKVPSALLEEFKTATNWSEYADKMVGV